MGNIGRFVLPSLFHLVQRGESLRQIAKKVSLGEHHVVTVQALEAANPGKIHTAPNGTKFVYEGETLTIPNAQDPTRSSAGAQTQRAARIHGAKELSISLDCSTKESSLFLHTLPLGTKVVFNTQKVGTMQFSEEGIITHVHANHYVVSVKSGASYKGFNVPFKEVRKISAITWLDNFANTTLKFRREGREYEGDIKGIKVDNENIPIEYTVEVDNPGIATGSTTYIVKPDELVSFPEVTGSDWGKTIPTTK